jgi:hypothetical protein
MVDIEKIQKKYAMDSKGAFGNVKNPVEKSDRRNEQYNKNLNTSLALGSEKLRKIDAEYDKILKSIWELQDLSRGFSLLQNAARNLENHVKTFKKVRNMASKQSRADNRKYLRQKESGIH